MLAAFPFRIKRPDEMPVRVVATQGATKPFDAATYGS
jgi:hypothetical protein